MKAVITGGAGFIGSNLVRALEEAGHETKVIDIRVDPQLDVRDLDLLKREFANQDVVFHLAALPSVPHSIEHPRETHETNLTGTLNVLIATRDTSVRRVVFSSSAAVYGDQKVLPVQEGAFKHPLSPYAIQKLASEMYLKHFADVQGVETVSLRYFNVYGEGQDPSGPYAGAVAKFAAWMEVGEPLRIVGDGEQTRDFVHVSDVVRANIAAATSAKVGKGEAINIATGKNMSMNTIAALFGGPIQYLPPRIEIKDSVANIALAKELLDWEPQVELEEGIKTLLKRTISV